MVMEAVDYYPFGETRIDDKSTSYENDYKFTGKELDEETDLYYFGARYYMADAGMWVSIDPLVQGRLDKKLLTDPQKLNGYSYVYNNPLRYVDPNGK